MMMLMSLLLREQILPLTLLHSEQPKLYGILAVLSAIGLPDDPVVKGDKNENDRVAFFQSVSTHPRDILVIMGKVSLSVSKL